MKGFNLFLHSNVSHILCVGISVLSIRNSHYYHRYALPAKSGDKTTRPESLIIGMRG
ncbi:hypothetical protein RBB75_13560 [Tunturibacter empetritectus]|uniref:Uncharacterized protein n=1 Tax=Tunturiibacter empetritectus TaxID=3069691 RepID=A0AAU7Z977_9BACT